MKSKIILKRPLSSDLKDLKVFFEFCLQTVMISEGIEDIDKFVKEETQEKINFVTQDLLTKGDRHYFLIAKVDEQIVGTIGYVPTGALINQLSEGIYKDFGEIGSVFVHPERHNQGIGSLMLNAMFLVLWGKGVTEFCLDSGYTVAKKIWTHKLGEPSIISKDHWGEGFDHYVWVRKLEDLDIEYNIKG